MIIIIDVFEVPNSCSSKEGESISLGLGTAQASPTSTPSQNLSTKIHHNYTDTNSHHLGVKRNVLYTSEMLERVKKGKNVSTPKRFELLLPKEIDF
jgi:hypothetical protein